MEVSGKKSKSEEENAKSIDIMCEPCHSEKLTTPANGFCKDCDEFMCNDCFRKHLNLKLCRHHVLVDGDLTSLSFHRSDERKINCKQHSGETVKFYCRTHEVVGCGDCMILQHISCQPELIQALSDNFEQNEGYKSLKENIAKVISEQKSVEKEIKDNQQDNTVMLEKALGDIRQFRLDINEYLDKVESDVIAKVKNIMRENEILLTKLENDCKTLSTALEKITTMLNSELFKDDALFIHTVECKQKVTESEVAISDMKSKTMKKYKFVPEHLRCLSTTAENFGTVVVSTMNVFHQTVETADDEGRLPTSQSADNMCKEKSSNTSEKCLSSINSKLDAGDWNIANTSVIKEDMPGMKADTVYSLSSCESIEKYRIHEVDVYVYKANILQLQVECIVNASNGSLSHGGGIAGVIARAAGKRLTDECDRFISQNGHLAVGQACSTTAGNLHYRCVIHTVGPRWSDYSPYMSRDVQWCEIDLYHAIYNCFIEGEKKQVKTVAIPAVGSGIFCVPAEICVNQYARATIDYCKKAVGRPNVLSEIHFIDVNLEMVKKIQDIFNILVREGKTSPYNRNKYAQKTGKKKKS